jgi:hypothetical protein
MQFSVMKKTMLALTILLGLTPLKAMAAWEAKGDTAMVTTYFPTLGRMKDVHVIFTLAFKPNFNCKSEVGTLVFNEATKLGAATKREWQGASQMEVIVDGAYKGSGRTILTNYTNGMETVFAGSDELVSKIKTGRVLHSRMFPEFPQFEFDIAGGTAAIDQVRKDCKLP